MEEDGRGDVVRHVAHQDEWTGGELSERHAQDVGLGDQHVVAPGISLAKQLSERPVVFNRDEPSSALNQNIRQRTATRPDLEHRLVPGEMQRVRDATEDATVREKMLSKTLARGREAPVVAPRRARVVRHRVLSF